LSFCRTGHLAIGQSGHPEAKFVVSQSRTSGTSGGPAGGMTKRQTPVKVEGSSKRPTRGNIQTKEKARKVRPLYPIAPLNTEDREEFGKTLDKMGLRGLLDLCWNYCDQDMANEVFGNKPHPDFKGTVRGQPKKITEKMIGQAFGISTKGEDAFGKGDNQALSYFPAESISNTDRWQVKQCTDPELKLVLAYLNLSSTHRNPRE
jgi:hypothetical protein